MATNAFTKVGYVEIGLLKHLQVTTEGLQGFCIRWMSEFHSMLDTFTIAEIIAALPAGNGEEPANCLKEIYTQCRDALLELAPDEVYPAWVDL